MQPVWACATSNHHSMRYLNSADSLGIKHGVVANMCVVCMLALPQ
jgi:hypothetical protein